MNKMLPAAWKKTVRRARGLLFTAAFVVFSAVVVLGKKKFHLHPGFDVHVFAKFNAFINSTVSILLLIALLAVLSKKYILHKRLMTAAIILSCMFLLSYICHHLLAAETKFGGKGTIRYVYYFILGTH